MKIYIVLPRTCPAARARRPDTLLVVAKYRHTSPAAAWAHWCELAVGLPAPELYVIVGATGEGDHFTLEWSDAHDPQGLPDEIAAARRDDA